MVRFPSNSFCPKKVTGTIFCLFFRTFAKLAFSTQTVSPCTKYFKVLKVFLKKS